VQAVSQNEQDRQKELAELLRRVGRLEEALARLIGRVYTLEQGRVERTVAPGAQREEPPSPRLPAVPGVPPAVVPPPPASPTTPQTLSASQRFESEVALKWMSRVGVVALLLAAAFFLQYAFANNWIGPRGQVAIGIFAGLALLVAGERNRDKGRRAFAEALTGGGLAIIYAAIYAAYAFYHPRLIGQPVAFGFMVLVTALGVAVSVRANALSTAVLATGGGLLTPVLVQGGGGGAGAAGMTVLFGYLAVLDLGLLAVSLFRRWLALQVLTFAGTWLMIWGWMLTHYERRLLWPTLAVELLFFAIFAFVPVVRNLWRRIPTRPAELSLILANPACFFPTTAALLASGYEDYLGLYAVVMAVVYLLLGNVAWARNREDRMLSLSWLGLGLAFVVVAVPLQLRGHWLMLGWAAEGTALMWIGMRLRSRALRAVGLVLEAIVVVWMLALYPTAPYHLRLGFTPVFNETFLAFLGGLGALAVTQGVYARGGESAREAAQAMRVIAILLGLLPLWGLTAELLRTFEWWPGWRAAPAGTAAFAVSALWCAYATALVGIGMARRYAPVRLLGILVFGLAVLKVFLFDLSSVGQMWRIFSFACLGAILIGVSYLYHLYGERIRAFALQDSRPQEGSDT